MAILLFVALFQASRKGKLIQISKKAEFHRFVRLFDKLIL